MSVLTLSSSGPLARAINRFTENRAALVGLAILAPMLIAILSYPLWLPYKPNDIDLLAMNSAPSAKHWFGADGVGRDVLARTLEGGRISLLVAVSSVILSTSIGFLVGAISAFGGRWADAIAMRSVDLAMTLPPVIFLLVLASIIGSGIWSDRRRHLAPLLAGAVADDPRPPARTPRARLRHGLARHGRRPRPPALPPRPAELDRHPRGLRHAAGRQRHPARGRPLLPRPRRRRRPPRAGATC